MELSWLKMRYETLRKFQRKHSYSQSMGILIGAEAERIETPCAIRKIIYFGSLLKFLPFQWNLSQGRMEIGSVQSQTLVNLNLTWIFSYVGLKLYFLVYKQMSNHGSCRVSYSIAGSLFFVMFGLALMLHFNNIYNLEDIVCTINTYSKRIRNQLGKMVFKRFYIHFDFILCVNNY